MDNTPVIPEDGAGREAFWTAHIEAWRQSELTQPAYARRESIVGLPTPGVIVMNVAIQKDVYGILAPPDRGSSRPRD